MSTDVTGSQPIDPDNLDDDDAEEIHPRDLWAIARFLGPFARPYRRPLIVLAGILLVETLINACFPLATQYLIDEGLTDPKNLNVVIGVLIFLAAATAVITILGVALDYITSKVFSAM